MVEVIDLVSSPLEDVSGRRRVVGAEGAATMGVSLRSDPFASSPRGEEGVARVAARSAVMCDSMLGACRESVQGEVLILSDGVDGDLSYSVDAGPWGKKRRRLSPAAEVEVRRKERKGEATSSGLGAGRPIDRSGLKRSISDITSGSRSNIAKGKEREGTLKRSKSSITEEDPIVFTSSPDVVRVARERREKMQRERQELTRIHEDDDDIFGNSPPQRNQIKTVTAQKNHSPGPFELSSDLDLPDFPALASQPVPSSYHADSARTLEAYKSSRASEQKAREKVRMAAEKAAAKEAEKTRKRLAREEKAREKQAAADIARVNTLRTDKKISTPEMIVDLPAGLDARLANQVRQFLGRLAVQVDEWDCTPHGVKDVVRWRRKVEARYNEELGYWEPTPKHIRPERHVLCVLHAAEFVELSCAEDNGGGEDLGSHVRRIKAAFGDCAIIYLVEGLTAWMRKNRNVKNRQFVDAVRSQMGPESATGDAAASASTSTRRKRGRAQEARVVDEDLIEDSLLRLQVVHGTLIHHTATMVETAQWVVAFTQHISTIPYRHQRMTLDTAFCMEAGQVKTGDSADDTFVKMLQEVNRISAPIAHGIAAAYPSPQRLVRAFELAAAGPTGGLAASRDLLRPLRKAANRDGAFTDREIGARISRRVWNLFMSRDEACTDV
ncbi:MAG: hypothetical protein M1818_001810 [Claussenomyces sp. TS43310]|nr:MAG: hypothetical protein M1818_001810 [Claussenomyces sp. TS43310]